MNKDIRIEHLETALKAIMYMAEDRRARVNMPDGESLGSYCRRVLNAAQEK